MESGPIRADAFIRRVRGIDGVTYARLVVPTTPGSSPAPLPAPPAPVRAAPDAAAVP
jgi:hypothetical protein